VKYIDENTVGRYVVLTTSTWTALIGHGFVGTNNPPKYYIYGTYLYPSISEIFALMENFQSGVAYFIVPSFRTGDFESVVAEASKNYGLFKVLNNDKGEIDIFYYKVPYLPEGHPNPDANVMAFYWDTPSSYNVQNGLGRISFNPSGKNLDVRDFYGALYESIDLSGSLVDGEHLGNLTSVEYFARSTWVEWVPSQAPISGERFQFRLNFQNGSLLGVMEKSKPFAQL